MIARIGFHEMIQAVIGPLIDIPRIPMEPGTLLADLRLDALDRATIAVELDEAYGIEIPDADVEKWLTLSDIAATLKRLAPQEDYQPAGQVKRHQPKTPRIITAEMRNKVGRYIRSRIAARDVALLLGYEAEGDFEQFERDFSEILSRFTPLAGHQSEENGA